MEDEPSPKRGRKELSPRASKALKVFRNIAIMFVVILILLVGAAVLYTWLSGKEQVAPTIAEPLAKPQLKEKTRRTLDPNTPVGVSIQSITSPIEPGQNALLIAKTKPEAMCTVVVEYNKVKSTDSGLSEKQADEYGIVQWSFQVPADTPRGAWPVTITCAYNEMTGVVAKDIVVGTEE